MKFLVGAAAVVALVSLSQVFGANLDLNLLLVLAAILVIAVSWLHGARVLAVTGFLVLSAWNLGNGLILTNFILDAFVAVAILFGKLSGWGFASRRLKGILILVFCVFLVQILSGNAFNLRIVHLQLQGLGFAWFCAIAPGVDAKLARQTLFLLGITFSLYGIMEYLLTQTDRTAGPHESATAFGACLAMIFAFLYPTGVDTEAGSKWLYRAASGLLLVAIVLTGTRAALLGAVLTLVITHLLHRNRTSRDRSLLVFASIVVIGGLVWTVAPSDLFLKKSFSGISGGELDASTLGRLLAWKFAVEFWQESPLLGIGIGQFFERFPELPYLGKLQHAHSLYLNTLAEIGLVGFLTLLVLIVVGVSSSWKAMADPGSQLSGKSFLSCLLATCLLGLFDTIPFYPSLVSLAWFVYVGALRLPEGSTRE